MNEVIKGHLYSHETDEIIREILEVYTEDCHWNAPLVVSTDPLDQKLHLTEVHNHVIEVCLLVEGIGKIALLLQKNFQKYSLKLLYMVLEKAGKLKVSFRFTN